VARLKRVTASGVFTKRATVSGAFPQNTPRPVAPLFAINTDTARSILTNTKTTNIQLLQNATRFKL
jgi:hypothetical protein